MLCDAIVATKMLLNASDQSRITSKYPSYYNFLNLALHCKALSLDVQDCLPGQVTCCDEVQGLSCRSVYRPMRVHNAISLNYRLIIS